MRDAMLHCTPARRKALHKELIEGRVESRDCIIPTFRLPSTAVCVTKTVVDPSFRNANQAEIVSRGIGFGVSETEQ